MSAVPNRDRASAAADAAEQRASAPVPREREDAAVAGQGAAVDRLTAMGFTLEHSRFGLAQGFPSVEEAVAFLFAGGADDLDAQRVLASSTPAGTALLRPGASRGTEACGVLAGGGASATGRRSGTARSGWAHPRHLLLAPHRRLRRTRRALRRRSLCRRRYLRPQPQRRLRRQQQLQGQLRLQQRARCWLRC